ncbi:MAG: type I asparaginase [Bacteroidales bacterium]|jgi:L-asparaginase|nr:type I asparaginase [Bacteroidales bacterium]
MDKKNAILVIYTGGTIGMISNLETHKLEPIDFENIYERIPVLKEYPSRIDYISAKQIIDSSDVMLENWVEIAGIIEKNYNDYDGFVVLHGTDTMSYTASALSFMLENLNKPVVITGSQLPVNSLRTDGRENFITSIVIASEGLVPEVCLYFDSKLFRGNRTTKLTAENFDAFLSGSYPSLANVGVHIKYNKRYFAPRSQEALKVHYKFNANINVLRLFPGITQKMIRDFFNMENLQGVVLQTYGNGNAPTVAWFKDELKQAIEKGIIFYNVSQCIMGGVSHGKYKASLDMEGIARGHDITAESGITKLMFLLGQEYDQEKTLELLSASLRGEMTVLE